MRRHYFQHCEISPTCIANRGLMGAFHEAASRLIKEYVQITERLSKEPNGRVLVTVGWQTPPDDEPISPDPLAEVAHAHRVLDMLGVPRTYMCASDGQLREETYTLLGRMTALQDRINAAEPKDAT